MRDDDIRAALANVNDGHEWVRVLCPRCHDDGWRGVKQNLAYNTQTTYYECHRCHVRGFLDARVASLPRAVRAKRAPLVVGPQVVLPATYKPWIPNGSFPLTSGHGNTLPFLSYLKSRFVPWEAIEQLPIRGCTSGPYAGHVIVPVHAPDGAYVGFVARSITGRDYRYPYGMPRQQSFFNGPRLLDHRPIAVVEGVFDALPHWPDAVACLGKPTPAHLSIIATLRGAPRLSESISGPSRRWKVVVALDHDASAWSWASHAALGMRGVSSEFMQLRPGEDPGVVHRHEIAEKLHGKQDQEGTTRDEAREGEGPSARPS